eukprot:TRINITY_DN732_c0_g1_i1.p1 TRINITY_DN732_c0_g1~~TRINITY_DN732_c0_g1_i1.p1  ORF type:complete len:414 (+),score=100.00 TRINITY_DN732_c0_g1_i1:47-1243(+)
MAAARHPKVVLLPEGGPEPVAAPPTMRYEKDGLRAPSMQRVRTAPEPTGKSRVHRRLPAGGGEPKTAFGRRAKHIFDPILIPLIDFDWRLASAIMIAIPIGFFYAVGWLLSLVYVGGTPGTALAPLYTFFRTWVFGSWTSHALYPSLLSTAQTWGLCIFYTLFDLTLPSWARKRRIQNDREAGEFPPLGLWNAVWHQTKLYFYLVPVFAYQYMVGGPSLYGPPWMEPCTADCNSLPEDPPTVVELAVHMTVAFVMFDTAYWYWHWMHHHHRKLWVNVHRHHHEYNTPFAFVSMYLHPLEFAATGLFSVIAPIALGAHPLTVWLIILFHVWLSIEAHTGYDLEFALQHWTFGLIGGTPHHDEHHRRPTSNFQPFLTFWEHLCGTYYEAGSADPGAVTKE